MNRNWIPTLSVIFIIFIIILTAVVSIAYYKVCTTSGGKIELLQKMLGYNMFSSPYSLSSSLLFACVLVNQKGEYDG